MADDWVFLQHLFENNVLKQNPSAVAISSPSPAVGFAELFLPRSSLRPFGGEFHGGQGVAWTTIHRAFCNGGSKQFTMWGPQDSYR
jgi:hypothetical protein